MEFLNKDLAKKLPCQYSTAVLHIFMTATRGLDDVPDLTTFLLENCYPFHNLLSYGDFDLTLLGVEGAFYDKVLKLSNLSMKISNFVFERASYGNHLLTGWDASIALLETGNGIEILSRCFLARFIRLVHEISEDVRHRGGKQEQLIAASHQLTEKMLSFLQRYSLMDTVGRAVAGP